MTEKQREAAEKAFKKIAEMSADELLGRLYPEEAAMRERATLELLRAALGRTEYQGFLKGRAIEHIVSGGKERLEMASECVKRLIKETGN